MKSGIYIIKNTHNGKVYIGQSLDVRKRIATHKRLLRDGNHPNSYLQRAYNAAGGAMEFDVLEWCTAEMLDEREVFWIASYDAMNRERGYNRESGGASGQGWCKESRAARSGAGNPMYGRHHSAEFVEHMRIINRASSDKLTEGDVDEIKTRISSGERQSELAKEHGVSISTINKIAQGKNWGWVRPDLTPKTKAAASQKTAERAEKVKQRKGRAARARAQREKLADAVRKDFQAGIPKSETMARLGVSKTSYTRYTTELFNKMKSAKAARCVELRVAGMKVKDIAETLGIHRTTVTQYCKAYANTEGAAIDCVCND